MDRDLYECCECGNEFDTDDMACMGGGVYYCDACAEKVLDADDVDDEADP